MLDEMMSNSSIVKIKMDLFYENMEKFKAFANVPTYVKFTNRTDVYNYIEKISEEDPYRKGILKNGLKALADIIYIFNKSYSIQDSEVFIVFEKRHYDYIEQGLKGINLNLDEVKKLYKDKEIKIIKIKIYPLDIDNDLSFFIKNVLPSELIIKKNENLPDKVIQYLEEKEDYERLSFLRFIKKREKYSKIIERRFPRLRSAIEIFVFMLLIIDIYSEIIITKELTYLNILLLTISIILSIDGILGFVEYISAKKLNTNFYEKVKSWYNNHIAKIKNTEKINEILQ
jgi:hypothetical protein